MLSRQTKRTTSVWVRYALLPVLAFGLLSFASAADYPEAGDFANGSKLWAENCGRCHQVRNPQDLRDDQWITTVFHMRIRAGLTGGEARDILTFLQSSNRVIEPIEVAAVSTEATTDVPAQSGEDIYAGTCVACHGPNGKGALPGTPDFSATDGPLSKSDLELMQNILSGYQSPGSPMPMPPKGGNPALTESGIAAVIQYLRDTFSN